MAEVVISLASPSIMCSPIRSHSSHRPPRCNLLAAVSYRIPGELSVGCAGMPEVVTKVTRVTAVFFGAGSGRIVPKGHPVALGARKVISTTQIAASLKPYHNGLPLMIARRGEAEIDLPGIIYLSRETAG